jgi:predicted PurR-regulated permease PerM
MDYLIEFFQKPYIKKAIILLAICGILYFTRSLLTLFLMTFLFIFLVNSLQNFLFKYIRKVIPVRRTIIIVLLYAIFLSIISIAAYAYIPVIISEIKDIFNTELPELTKSLNSNGESQNILIQSIVYISGIIDISKYTQVISASLIDIVKNFGVVCLYFFLSSILSMFFMIEKNKIKSFMETFKSSRVGWIYDELCFFGGKFANSFGKVIEAQILISLVNTILSVIVLAILRFPNLIGLGTMIFLFGLIPIAGAIISLLPLSIIAYSHGGIWDVLYIIILVAILHALESYVLNPNIMSYKTKLPVFFTFLVLIVGEHFFGVWGLIVGLPLTIFVLDLLDAKPKETYKPTFKKIKT